jgi:tRNA threonylcarbamoyladenosine biosynthesis protein TsaE
MDDRLPHPPRSELGQAFWDGYTFSPEQTQAIGRVLGGLCRGGDIVTLQGPLGSGKTQVVRGLTEGLGLDPLAVSSPTFVIAQEYDTPLDPARGAPSVDWPILVHIDAYRLSGEDDLISAGLEAYLDPHALANPCPEPAVLAIEWPERLASLVNAAPSVLRMWLDHDADERRYVCVQPTGSWLDRQTTLRERLRLFDLSG